ncbi:MAG: hypothetical protein ACJAV1_001150 [Paraglaciecola sp.]
MLPLILKKEGEVINSKSITRRKTSEDPYSFTSLRREGIKYAQTFSGEIWTDYNAHDPGVTILEHLCYALTDLIYRTDFTVEDYLVDRHSQLNLEQLALHLPEKILPSRACTLVDNQIVILDAIDEIDNVWFSPAADDFPIYRGLYQINIQLTAKTRKLCQTRAGLKAKIIHKVARVYAKQRNLSEDIAAINIVGEQGYQLIAQVEVKEGREGREANDILAEMYFCTDQWLRGLSIDGNKAKNYEDKWAEGQSYEQIFNGPKTTYGCVQNEDLRATAPLRNLSSLTAQLINISGISHISDVSLVPIDINDQQVLVSASETENQTATNALFPYGWLYVPQADDDIKIILTRNGHPLAVDFITINSRVEQFQFKQFSISHTRQEVSSLYQPPQGTYRQLHQYNAIQAHFPSNYNLSVLGVTQSISITDVAKAQQLRGYLVLFEQLMANFVANLNGIRQLFSIDKSYKHSYQFQLLDHKSIKGLEQLYPPSAEQKFSELLASVDPFTERKARVLDYLLALYGEALNSKIFHQFNYYHTDTELATWLLQQKFDYIKAIVTLGKDRGGSYDQTRLMTKNNNQGGFHSRLSMHLGMTATSSWPYTQALDAISLTVIPDHQYKLPIAVKRYSIEVFARDLQQLIPVPSLPNTARLVHTLKTKIFKTVLLLKAGVISESLFSKLIDISRYKLINHEQEGKKSCKIYFQFENTNKLSQEQTLLYIGSSSTEEKAITFVNVFYQCLTELNQVCEGLYVVEHILLRPKSIHQNDDIKDEDPYSCQISIVLPSYTARCQDPAFRLEAESLILENCPAHILPHCYWLPFELMKSFEALYVDWLEARQKDITANEECFYAAEQLMTFLSLHAVRQTEGVIDETEVVNG